MLNIERHRNRIHLYGTTYSDAPRAKQVPAYKFHMNGGGDKAYWAYPLSMETCYALRSAFGSSLAVGRELAEWAKVEIETIKQQRLLAKATDAALPSVATYAPALHEAMASRSYQRAAAAFVAGANSGVLVADQPGLGKTIETLAGLVERGIVGPVAIFCPLTAVDSVWVPEIERWLAEVPHSIFIPRGPRKERQATIDAFKAAIRENVSQLTFLVCNVEMARAKGGVGGYPDMFGIQWSAQIVDELHRGLIHTPGKGTLVRKGLVDLPLAPGGLRIALSGTPMRGKPHHLWGALNWLRPEVYTSYWRWVDEYFVIVQDAFGRTIGPLRKDKEEALYNSLDPIMIRRTKKEVRSELPDKQYAGGYAPGESSGPWGIWLPMEGKQKRIYEQMALDAMATLDNGEIAAIGVLAELTRLKQFATSAGDVDDEGRFHPALPSNKLDWILEWLDERGISPLAGREGGGKVVIASQYTQILDVLNATLNKQGIETYLLTGATKQSDRTAMVNDFQQNVNSPKVFIINTKAGGVAITLDAADDLIFLDETWTPDDQEQVEDRIHRTSRIHQVTIWYLRSIGSVEEGIAHITSDREAIQKAILDTRRGVDVARSLINFGGKK